MPGPHDFAVRLMLFVGMIFSRCSIKASTASHPNVRDDREAPLFFEVGRR
jgi:hypothetical protein